MSEKRTSDFSIKTVSFQLIKQKRAEILLNFLPPFYGKLIIFKRLVVDNTISACSLSSVQGIISCIDSRRR